MGFVMSLAVWTIITVFYLTCIVMPKIRNRLTSIFERAFGYLFSNGIESDSNTIKNAMAKLAVHLIFLVIFIFLTSLFFSVVIVDDENKKTGPLGDLFNGILTPILTFFTFCGLLVTILVQQNQLKATLAELKANRKEAADGNLVLSGQLKNSAAQKFDSNFFSLLQKQEKILFDIKEYSDESGYFSNAVKSIYENIDGLERCWEREKDKFLMFFLINYQILDYISASTTNGIIGEDDARRYNNIVRAVTPNQFLILLLLNCRSDNFPEYKTHLTKARYFEHFSYENIRLKFVLILFGTWSVESFGNKDRIKKYLLDMSWDVKSHIRRIPQDISEDYNHLIEFMYKNNHNRNDVAHLKQMHDECLNYITNIFNRSFNIISIINNDEIFFAYVRQDIFYFLKTFHSDESLLTDFHDLISEKLFNPITI